MSTVYFEEIREGDQIPRELSFRVTTQQLVKWTSAVEDFYQIHYDKDYARNAGLPDVIVHGPLKCALLARFLTEWIGEEGRLRRLSCQHRRMNFPGETIFCRGRILNKFTEGEENLVEVEVWVENEKGEISAPGKATISLPSKKGR